MINGKLLVEKLLKYAKAFLHLNQRDEIYMRNILLREFKLVEPLEEQVDLSYIEKLDVPDEIVNEVEEYAIENNLTTELERNLYSTYIFGILSPLPSVVNETFIKIKETEGIEKACKYFYDLSIKNNYIQKTAISKNMLWIYQDGDRYLEITINLSKPEKDNKEIAKLLTVKPTQKAKYPACFLCKENEGFQGSLSHPARENIRTISLKMGGKDWFVQYSPYAYYNEHMIAISNDHQPMHIAGDTIDKIMDFVDFFPNYMIGSNAALPIIGGSILNHEHFQGGEHLMPMHKAPIKKMMSSTKYPQVKVGIVDWYNSVIRLSSADRQAINDFSTDIINVWEKYSDESVGIIAYSGETRHNSLVPVCRKDGDTYIMDMIFRNNRTSEEYPDGIFHAHPEYHNIKKEGIGLIEAMGLFILPGRLKKQLSMIADILCKNEKYDYDALCDKENYLFAHKDMIKALVEEGYHKDFASAEKRVVDYVNNVCKNILDNTAVFKNDEKGQKAFIKFLNACGIN